MKCSNISVIIDAAASAEFLTCSPATASAAEFLISNPGNAATAAEFHTYQYIKRFARVETYCCYY